MRERKHGDKGPFIQGKKFCTHEDTLTFKGKPIRYGDIVHSPASCPYCKGTGFRDILITIEE